MAVITDESAVSATRARARRSPSTRPTSSATRCSASDALPPLPNARTFRPDATARHMASAAVTILSSPYVMYLWCTLTVLSKIARRVSVESADMCRSQLETKVCSNGDFPGPWVWSQVVSHHLTTTKSTPYRISLRAAHPVRPLPYEWRGPTDRRVLRHGLGIQMTLDELTDPLARHVSEFKNRRVLVLGDAMLDEYLLGDCSRISPEAPVPVLRVNTARRVLGGAANTAANVVSLGGHATLIALVGNDEGGQTLRKCASEAGIDLLAVDHGLATLRKTRVV